MLPPYMAKTGSVTSVWRPLNVLLNRSTLPGLSAVTGVRELLLVALGPLTNLRGREAGPAAAAAHQTPNATASPPKYTPPPSSISPGILKSYTFSAFRKLDLVDWQATMDHALPVAELDDWLPPEPASRFL